MSQQNLPPELKPNSNHPEHSRIKQWSKNLQSDRELTDISVMTQTFTFCGACIDRISLPPKL
jgi:hypothetical protein